MSRCQFGWFERGAVRRHLAGRGPNEVPADEPRHAASLRQLPAGIIYVEAIIDGSTWYGRLMPKKNGVAEGPLVLFEQQQPIGD